MVGVGGRKPLGVGVGVGGAEAGAFALAGGDAQALGAPEAPGRAEKLPGMKMASRRS